MPLTFPEIKPNFIRTIDAPDYFALSNEWKSGVTSTIRTSYQGVNTTLSLEFQHITEDSFKALWDFYKSTKGGCYSFTLPTIIYSLIPDLVVTSILSLGSTSKWKFAQEPVFNLLVASEYRGRYNGQIILRSVTA
jgi:hypothetical protein